VQAFSDQAADHFFHCCLRLVFAYLTNEQAGLSLKYLVPLAAIGRAYVWDAGPSDFHARILHQIDYEHEYEQQEWKGPVVQRLNSG
jgi:hypothetical protein